eukprot:CAMPEP_0180790944 /NCGR_PEP_ID=MMETSP1038_2-20121128/53531_1 /TAXON_ID=632150 /ORGANISM="Azadinium spinosum, Strain 3D9" /LENGTH=40 /DNA_ID= /DNA_START= /DNA_END= /DNA_ORIENTATION=
MVTIPAQSVTPSGAGKIFTALTVPYIEKRARMVSSLVPAA